MDPAVLAGQAVELVGAYLSGIASGVVKQTQASAAQALCTLVGQRLRRTKPGSVVMDRLETEPTDQGTQEIAKATLTEEVSEDTAFASELQRAVEEVNSSQGNVDRSVVERQVNFHTGGGSVKNSVVAGGNVDQSRRTRIGLGGLLALLLIGGGAAGGYVISQNSPSSESQPSPVPNHQNQSGVVDPAALGAAPGEQGVREVATAVLKSIYTGDGKTFCVLLNSDTVTFLAKNTNSGSCESIAIESFQRGTPEQRAQLEQARVLNVEIDPGGQTARAQISPLVPGGAEYTFPFQRESDHWRMGCLSPNFHDGSYCP